MRSLSCMECHHPSGKRTAYGLILCGVCTIITEETSEGTKIYTQTRGETKRTFRKLVKR